MFVEVFKDLKNFFGARSHSVIGLVVEVVCLFVLMTDVMLKVCSSRYVFQRNVEVWHYFSF